jgi:M6 family metalloprotease-like protein
VFTINSYGQFTFDSVVTDWVTLPNTEAYYANGASGDSTLWEALRFALSYLDDNNIIDFDAFDANNDNAIDAIGFLHSGYLISSLFLCSVLSCSVI